MITFKSLKYKNFLSTGDKFTEVDLDRSKTTLVVGQNGAGKSTMLDAISFGLFGKPHRNINKPQLVNSINNKGMVVEVQFRVNGSDFKVVRGLKPTLFEIWKDDVMLNQSSHAKEYQKILEQNILKLNHKSFHQIVVLGSSSFIPFMQLPSHHRREVIEDLLDINVFSKMNQLLKEKVSRLKDDIRETDFAIEINDTKLTTQKKYIRDITRLNKEYREEKRNEVKLETDQLFELQTKNAELLEYVSEHKPALEEQLKEVSRKSSKLNSFESDFKNQMKSVVKESKFFEENESCPTCEQGIVEDIKNQKLQLARDRAKELQQALEKLKDSQSEVLVEQERINEELSAVYELQIKVQSNNQSISMLQTSIQQKQKDLESLEGDSSDLSKANKEFEETKNVIDDLRENKLVLNEQYQYNQVVSEMLKDTGIKTKIIKQYVPVINNLVNQYLQILDFFVHFELNESFSETIRSRHRDAFTYDSFSEGEKQRIDLSLLFTWRQVAKMKNSIATNLLILDETFDSSLDQDGVENLMKILHTLGKDTNVFVISHKGEMLDGKFQSKIEFIKERNFSKIKP